MKKKYSIPLGIAFLATISILSTSYIPVANEAEAYWPEPGSYEVFVKGDKEMKLRGQFLYKQVSNTEKHQDQTSTWNLMLKHEDKHSEHSFDFYIGDQINSSGLEEGIYHISEDIQGIFKEFDGVFGVADIGEYGELPYFTESGKIILSQIDGETLAGQLKLTLSNYLDEKIEVEGKFVAPNDL